MRPEVTLSKEEVLTLYATELGLGPRDQLAVQPWPYAQGVVPVTPWGRTTYYYAQIYNGVKVIGHGVTVIERDGAVLSVRNDILPNIDVSIAPAVSAEEALDVVLDRFHVRDSSSWQDPEDAPTATLSLVEDPLRGGASDLRLIWVISFAQSGLRAGTIFWVDAQTGELIYEQDWNFETRTARVGLDSRSMADLDLDLALATARRAVVAASAASLTHFHRGLLVELKPDKTPVTAADRDAEAAIFRVVHEVFPDHAVLGEETGEHSGSSETRWIIDPIDGTRGFTRGGSFWGPLLGLEHQGEIVAGAMAMPALGETYWAARGLGAWLQRGTEPPVQIRVSDTLSWADATLSLGEIRALFSKDHLEPVTRLALTAAQVRCYGDLAGCAMVLTGRADVWIEAGVQIWDLAPLQILVEEAGGRFTDFHGKPTVKSGHCVASNGRLHDYVLGEMSGPGGQRT